MRPVRVVFLVGKQTSWERANDCTSSVEDVQLLDQLVVVVVVVVVKVHFQPNQLLPAFVLPHKYT